MKTLSTALLAVFLCLGFNSAYARTVIFEKYQGDMCLHTSIGKIMQVEFLKQVRRRTPQIQITVLKSKDVKAYFAELRALKPMSRMKAPHVLIVSKIRPDVTRLGLTGFGKSGCVVVAGSVSDRFHKTIMNKLRGLGI